MKTQHIRSLVYTYLVVSKILNVLDAQIDPNVHPFLNPASYHIGHLSDGVVPRSQIEYSRDLGIRFNCPNVGGRGIFNTQDGTPNRRIVDRDDSVSQRRLEHGIDDQVQAHSRAVP